MRVQAVGLALVALVSEVAGYNCGEWREKWDYYGHDLTDSIQTSNRDDCMAKCKQFRDCNAFTWLSNNKQCWLKKIPNDYDGQYNEYGNAQALCYSGQCDKWQDKWDYYGYDIKHKKEVNSKEQCMAHCNVLRQCNAFTWIPGKNDCWLKNIPPEFDGRGHENGQSRRLCSDSRCDAWIDGWNFYGYDIKSTELSSKEDCMERCQEVPGCNAFTFHTDNYVCYMKDVPADYLGYKQEALKSRRFCDHPKCDQWQDNWDLHGYDIKSVKSDNKEECLKQCRNLAGCNAVTYVDHSDKCWLKYIPPQYEGKYSPLGESVRLCTPSRRIEQKTSSCVWETGSGKCVPAAAAKTALEEYAALNTLLHLCRRTSYEDCGGSGSPLCKQVELDEGFSEGYMCLPERFDEEAEVVNFVNAEKEFNLWGCKGSGALDTICKGARETWYNFFKCPACIEAEVAINECAKHTTADACA